ncbi:FMRFamide receptor [Trichinella pseudospiralis]|uniref:FMRFamide receptor n=1 Tax=Trichinella pseudospiralis TaxID=6337 RepID=A0A0V1IXL3_TRIPS|nr:FMRFamide receptor [Trichinella pseudospiralis]KRY72389.1 FMRFamide receptor [Trichinella pseudospiralis]KRZ27498.1 FMRFamide receptor [Trichinella pseudospiralis]KRZ39671.1 FMRFamide receptor [Trichinella pseudospiralis]
MTKKKHFIPRMETFGYLMKNSSSSGLKWLAVSAQRQLKGRHWSQLQQPTKSATKQPVTTRQCFVYEYILRYTTQVWPCIQSGCSGQTRPHLFASPRLADHWRGDALLLPTRMTEANDTCHYEKHEWLEEKFYLISVCGTAIALFGIIANITTALVLKRPKMRSPSNIYLNALAICDCFLLVTAVMLYSVEYVYEYFENVLLYKMWYSYVKYCYPLSNAAQTGSIYITVSVTFERYLAVVHPNRRKLKCQQSTTTPVIVAVVVFSIIFNFSKFFEIDIVERAECPNFSHLALVSTPLLSDEIYRYVYTLWLSQLVQVLIPFFTLLIFNTAIAISARKQMHRERRLSAGQAHLNEMKERSRDATVILIVVVLNFLICNSWGLVMTLMEAFYGVPTLVVTWPKFYAFSREAVNFLAIVHSSINFIVYYSFGKDFRMELESMITSTRVTYLTRMAMEHMSFAKRLALQPKLTNSSEAGSTVNISENVDNKPIPVVADVVNGRAETATTMLSLLPVYSQQSLPSFKDANANLKPNHSLINLTSFNNYQTETRDSSAENSTTRNESLHYAKSA